MVGVKIMSLNLFLYGIIVIRYTYFIYSAAVTAACAGGAVRITVSIHNL